MKKAYAMLAPVALAAVIAGCGSSSSSTTSSAAASSASASSSTTSSTTAPAPTGGPLTEAQWKQQIDGICAGVTAQAKTLTKPTSLTGLPTYLQQIVNVGKGEIARIQAVNPPAAFKAGQTAVVADLGAIYGALQKLVDRHLTGSALSQAFSAYPASVQTPAQDYVNRSKAAGLKSCTVSGA